MPRATAVINLKFLQLFVKVAETGSIAAAARQLDIAPSIASRQIAALERAFGTRLVTRTTRRLALTTAGHSLLDWSRQTMDGYEELTDELDALQHRPSGTVRLATNDYAAVAYLPGLLARFCQTYPDLRIQVSTSNDPTRLLAGTYDLALHAGRMPEVNLIGRRIRQYRRVLCASTAYVTRKGRPAVPEDLVEHACLCHSASERLDWSFERDGEVVTQTVQPYIEVDNYLVLKELVFQGLGIARLSGALVGEALAAGTLVELLPGYRCLYADGALPAMWLVFADRKVLRRTRLLADFLVRELSLP